MRKAKNAFGCDDDGSVTLEASMVMPWVLMLTFMMLLFALYLSQGSILYYSSSIMTERAAFAWSNSAKNIRTGAYPPGQYDGLYWRLTDDGLVQSLFGLAGGDGDIRVDVYPGMPAREGSSAADKLGRAGDSTAAGHRLGTGSLSYRNTGIKREIFADMDSAWLPEPLVRFRGGGAARAGVSALIVEPAEFLRAFDLVRYYGAKMKLAPEGEESYRRQAGEILNKRRT
ncbi:TadE family protein [Paenibacillaceae bacterium WGS1546]|uniref:TadE family protein n=1 Tax=Cohnella sp. WGS1546 TaxID=3366810 RepID=UPI00372CF87D